MSTRRTAASDVKSIYALITSLHSASRRSQGDVSASAVTRTAYKNALAYVICRQKKQKNQLKIFGEGPGAQPGLKK